MVAKSSEAYGQRYPPKDREEKKTHTHIEIAFLLFFFAASGRDAGKKY